MLHMVLLLRARADFKKFQHQGRKFKAPESCAHVRLSLASVLSSRCVALAGVLTLLAMSSGAKLFFSVVPLRSCTPHHLFPSLAFAPLIHHLVMLPFTCARLSPHRGVLLLHLLLARVR